ncbi:DUF305 domain-containing protein [Sporichthya polymorpha]|uniref:DUF305 domain-containing protein n=1 Tax=Sporichthya polymorpha TaxID=35751 RepID=UPI0003624440|nr:DUF305 domain-containing protein [Sporichthya polymorpha]
MTGILLRGRMAAAAAVVMAATAACGGSGSPDAAAPAGQQVGPSFVQADVNFVVQLSQHHGQALRLAELAASRGRASTVKALAADIEASYAPQVDVLADWIRAWAAAGAELPGHEIGDGEAGFGMLPERAVVRLESLTGPAFDRQFRIQMARHHRGGLDLVGKQLKNGINPDARALAERLRTEQTEQLAQLQ